MIEKKSQPIESEGSGGGGGKVLFQGGQKGRKADKQGDKKAETGGQAMLYTNLQRLTGLRTRTAFFRLG